jgi:hypothetical protein
MPNYSSSLTSSGVAEKEEDENDEESDNTNSDDDSSQNSHSDSTSDVIGRVVRKLKLHKMRKARNLALKTALLSDLVGRGSTFTHLQIVITLPHIIL